MLPTLLFIKFLSTAQYGILSIYQVKTDEIQARYLRTVKNADSKLVLLFILFT